MDLFVFGVESVLAFKFRNYITHVIRQLYCLACRKRNKRISYKRIILAVISYISCKCLSIYGIADADIRSVR